MKKYRILLVIVVLVLASLACQGLSKKGGDTAPSSDAPVPESVTVNPSSSSNEDSGVNNSSDSNFPMTNDAFNVINVGDGTVLYYTKMSVEDVMNFYRDEYTARGYTEREILTVVSDGVFSMVFDGDPSGKAVVIQSVDLGDGSRTITIRLEDV